MIYIAVTLGAVAALLGASIIVDANLKQRPMSYARMIAGNAIHAILSAAKWVKGVWWYTKNARVAEAGRAIMSPSFAMMTAAYTEVIFIYRDNERVEEGLPGRWLAHMPVTSQGFPGHTWSTVELLPPDLGGRFVRVRITDAQPGDVESDMRALFDGQGIQIQRRAKVFKRNLSGPLRSQLESTGFYEVTFAQYTSLMEAF